MASPRISRSRRSPPPTPRIMCQPLRLVRIPMATAHGAPSSLSAGGSSTLRSSASVAPARRGAIPIFQDRSQGSNHSDRLAQGRRTGPVLRLLAAGACHLHEGQRRLPCTGLASRHPGTTRRAGQLRGRQRVTLLGRRGPPRTLRPRALPTSPRTPSRSAPPTQLGSERGLGQDRPPADHHHRRVPTSLARLPHHGASALGRFLFFFF